MSVLDRLRTHWQIYWRIRAFKRRTEGCAAWIRGEAIDSLAQTLLPRIRGRVPQRYKKLLPIGTVTDAILLPMLQQDLRKSFGYGAEIFNPELRCVLKDVTYESISDPRFRTALSKALSDFGGAALASQLFSEHDTAPEV